MELPLNDNLHDPPTRTELALLYTGDVFYVYEEDMVTLITVANVRLHPSRLFMIWAANSESKVINCSKIRDIRIIEKINKINPERSAIQICWGSDFVNLSLITFASSCVETVKKWGNNLSKVVYDPLLNNLCPLDIMKKQFLMLDSIRTINGRTDVTKIIRLFHGKMSEKELKKVLIKDNILSARGTELSRDFDEELFSELVDKLVDRPDIEEIFSKQSHGSELMDLDSFETFINHVQRDKRLNTILFPHKTREDCLEIMLDFEKDQLNLEKKCIGLRGFQRYLSSGDNMVISTGNHVGVADMNHPLCHYFINSSHNTYLVGRQFGGKSSVEIYRSILIAGCRCVELDCWDGKEEEEPIITHGMAACTEVLFRDVIREIGQSAFITSDLPVILSFENHCSYKQQKKMVDYCTDIFGDLLLKESLHDYPLAEGIPFPSPAQLRRKIIIKNKKLSPVREKIGLADVEKMPGDTEVDYTTNDMADMSEIIKVYHRQQATTNVHPELSVVINYVQSVKFAGFQAAQDKNYNYHISSFSENVGFGLIKNSATLFVDYNKAQLSRIYPKGARFESSNYLPQLFWNAGCQLVALNFQSAGPYVQLNQGKFEYHGNTGYLLKPLCMRSTEQSLNPFTEATIDGIIAAQCSVTVISAQFLSDKKISTIVEVDMYGLPTDTIRKEFKSKVVPSNGLNPFYGEPPFIFRKIVLPELAILKIAVFDSNNGKLIGQRHLPFELIQNGFRYVSLRTEANTPLNLPTVLCHFELSTYVPDDHGDFADALSDPSRFLSDAEKARKMLNNMGVEDTEIEEDYEDKTTKNECNESKCPVNLHLPTIAQLQEDSEYVQMEKRCLAELHTLKESFLKRRTSMSKDQCGAFVKQINKVITKRDSQQNVEKLNVQQNQKWKDMITSQEYRVLLKNQDMFKELSVKLNKIALKSHDSFRKKLDKKLKSISTEMLEKHASKSVLDLAKLKNENKAERLRKTKELKDAQLKKFMEQRRNMEDEREYLEKYWNDQMEIQLEEIRNVVEKKCTSLRLKKHTLDAVNHDEAYI